MRLYEKGAKLPLMEKELLQIHSLVTKKMIPANEIGIYRKTNVNSIFNEANIRYPQGIEVPYQMEDFFRYLLST